MTSAAPISIPPIPAPTVSDILVRVRALENRIFLAHPQHPRTSWLTDARTVLEGLRYNLLRLHHHEAGPTDTLITVGWNLGQLYAIGSAHSSHRNADLARLARFIESMAADAIGLVKAIDLDRPTFTPLACGCKLEHVPGEYPDNLLVGCVEARRLRLAADEANRPYYEALVESAAPTWVGDEALKGLQQTSDEAYRTLADHFKGPRAEVSE
jgi:hypothetical protein